MTIRPALGEPRGFAHNRTMNLIPPLGDAIFYPSDPAELSILMETLLGSAGSADLPGRNSDNPLGIITPHGAYDFTGNLMARAYDSVKHLNPEWILLAGPVHLEQEPGIFLPPEDGFHTPLGEVPVFQEGREFLVHQPGFSLSAEPYREEPALELQLPFIRHLFPGVPVLPLYLSGSGRKRERTLAAGIGNLGLPSLTVITSNLSPYEIPRISGVKARQFIDAAARPDFDPRHYPAELHRPCGLSLLGGLWDAMEGALRISLLDWGSDRPDPEENQKCAVYGAYTLNRI